MSVTYRSVLDEDWTDCALRIELESRSLQDRVTYLRQVFKKACEMPLAKSPWDTDENKRFSSHVTERYARLLFAAIADVCLIPLTNIDAAGNQTVPGDEIKDLWQSAHDHLRQRQALVATKIYSFLPDNGVKPCLKVTRQYILGAIVHRWATTPNDSEACDLFKFIHSIYVSPGHPDYRHLIGDVVRNNNRLASVDRLENTMRNSDIKSSVMIELFRILAIGWVHTCPVLSLKRQITEPLKE